MFPQALCVPALGNRASLGVGGGEEVQIPLWTSELSLLLGVGYTAMYRGGG